MQDRTHSFGYWLKRRRKALDLTQDALAELVCCSGFTIRKIEADERRPSRHLAQRLALTLAIPAAEQAEFLDAARAQRSTDTLPLDAEPVNIQLATMPTTSAAHAADTTLFVGRQNEYGLLAGLVARLTTGSGYSVLIEGEPGIGKSRLLGELERYVRAQSLPVLMACCYEMERAIPYQALHDLVLRALALVDNSTLHKLGPVPLAELAALVPEVADRFADLPPLSNDFPEARQARLARAVYQLLESARDQRPAIVMVDDIQWLDAASAQVLHYLSRQTAQRPVLLVCAYRDEALASDAHFAQLIASLRRDSQARCLTLGRLNLGDIASLMADSLPAADATPELAERLQRETEGNPFFLLSILHSLRAGEIQIVPCSNNAPELLPDALRAAVRARLANVPQDIRPVLETAAVLGRRFDFDTLLNVMRLPEAILLNAVDALVNRRLLREEKQGGIYDFNHDKLREVVYHDISGARRKRLHHSVAETLEQQDETASVEMAARLAEHYERAQNWSKALHYLQLAGKFSQALFALRDAMHWLDRAVTLAEQHPDISTEKNRLQIYAQRGAARAQAGHTQSAVDDMRRVIQAARAQGERETTRDMLIQLGMAYRRADRYDEATTCLTEALAESRALADETHVADTLYHLGTVAWSTGNNHQAITFHQQAVEICERVNLSNLAAVQAWHGRGEAHFAHAEPDAAIRCYQRSIDLARKLGDKSYESENRMMIGHACLGSKGLGDYPRAIEHFSAALEIARNADLQWHLAPTLLGLDHAQACTGHYAQAWRGMQHTLQWLESLQQSRYQFIAYDYIGYLLLDLELNEQAREYMQRGVALGEQTGNHYWRTTICAQLAVAQTRLGQTAEVQQLQNLLEQSRQQSERYLQLRALGALAEISCLSGDAGHCRDYANELLRIAVENNLREQEAVARYWLGEAWFMDQHYPAAQAEWQHAATLADAVGRVRLQMDIHLALAKMHEQQAQLATAATHDAAAATIREMIKKDVLQSDLQAALT